MKDELIAYETAVLARERGFEVKVRTAYFGMKSKKLEFNKRLDNYNNQTSLWSAPTQSLLQRWLREKHNMEITVSPAIVGKYSFAIYQLGTIINIVFLYGRNVKKDERGNVYFNSYEEALEEGLLQALKLI